MFKVNKSCWNCKKSIGYRTRAIPQTYWQPGEPAMVEGCDSNLPDDAWEKWDDEFNANSCGCDEIEDYIGQRCSEYESEECTCSMCHKEIKVNDAIAVHDMYDLSHTCSYTCATILKMRIDDEIKESLEDC